MPRKQDIITAIKNLDLFLKIPELKGAKPKLNPNGSPFVFAGGFNLVFQLLHNSKKWAFRIWHVPMGENKERYQAISQYLGSKNLTYFADFIYDEKGILINGELLDTIRMEWLEGDLMKDYVEKNLNNKPILENLANEFLEMTKVLRLNQISHGDLQEGNILIDTSGKIKLVDYDSVCIPEIEGQLDLVTGLKGYQHPSRFKGGKASLKADFFSELVIYLSILAIAENPDLWNKYQVKDTQYLLFSENDFDDFHNSKIYNDLKGSSLLINSLLDILTIYLKESNYLNLNPFQGYLKAPDIILFKPNKNICLEGGELTLSWEIENAIKVEIQPEIGIVKPKDSITFKPHYQKYKIVATGYLEENEAELEIRLFPTPIIETIFVPTPKINEELKLGISIPQFPDLNIGIQNLKNSIELNPLQLSMEIPSFNEDEIQLIKLIEPRPKAIYRFSLKPLNKLISSVYKNRINKRKSKQPR